MFCFITYFLATIASYVMGDALMLFVPNSLMAVAYVFRKLLDGDRFIVMVILSTFCTKSTQGGTDSMSQNTLLCYLHGSQF